jgi:hypothetical protein
VHRLILTLQSSPTSNKLIMIFASPWPRKSTNHYQWYWRDPNLHWDRIAPVGGLGEGITGATQQSNSVECRSAQDPCHAGSSRIMIRHHGGSRWCKWGSLSPLFPNGTNICDFFLMLYKYMKKYSIWTLYCKF